MNKVIERLASAYLVREAAIRIAKKQKLPTSKGTPRYAEPKEFGLMAPAPVRGQWQFKHHDTRNYVFIDARNGKMTVPQTTQPFMRGEFDKYAAGDLVRVAGMGPELFGKIVDRRGLARVQSRLMKEDRQSADLIRDVMLYFINKLDLSANEEAAYNRLTGVASRGSSMDAALLRNEIFKMANLLGIKLPSAMFASRRIFRASLTKRHVMKLLQQHGIPGEVKGSGASWEVEVPNEAAMKKLQKVMPAGVGLGGYRTGYGAWVLTPNYQSKGDWNDPSSKWHYASAKEASAVVVGDIFVSTWGYDQTNVDFYQVVGTSKTMVHLREIDKRMVRGRGEPIEYVVPTPNKFIGPVIRRKLKEGWNGGAYVSLNSYSGARKWDGREVGQTGGAYGH